MPAKLYVYDTLLERLAQDLQDLAAALGAFIPEQHAVVGQRHLARHGHVGPTDQSGIRDGMVGRATRAGRDQRRAGAGEASDVVEARSLDGLDQAHGREHGGEAARQHRRARPHWSKHEDAMVNSRLWFRSMRAAMAVSW
jgi:hypothetical protein